MLHLGHGTSRDQAKTLTRCSRARIPETKIIVAALRPPKEYSGALDVDAAIEWVHDNLKVPNGPLAG